MKIYFLNYDGTITEDECVAEAEHYFTCERKNKKGQPWYYVRNKSDEDVFLLYEKALLRSIEKSETFIASHKKWYEYYIKKTMEARDQLKALQPTRKVSRD